MFYVWRASKIGPSRTVPRSWSGPNVGPFGKLKLFDAFIDAQTYGQKLSYLRLFWALNMEKSRKNYDKGAVILQASNQSMPIFGRETSTRSVCFTQQQVVRSGTVAIKGQV